MSTHNERIEKLESAIDDLCNMIFELRETIQEKSEKQHSQYRELYGLITKERIIND